MTGPYSFSHLKSDCCVWATDSSSAIALTFDADKPLEVPALLTSKRREMLLGIFAVLLPSGTRGVDVALSKLSLRFNFLSL